MWEGEKTHSGQLVVGQQYTEDVHGCSLCAAVSKVVPEGACDRGLAGLKLRSRSTHSATTTADLVLAHFILLP